MHTPIVVKRTNKIDGKVSFLKGMNLDMKLASLSKGLKLPIETIIYRLEHGEMVSNDFADYERKLNDNRSN